MQDKATISTKPHYAILDGLRGVAAIIVVIFHLFEAHAANTHEQIINHGYLAVDFFFLLSGFVIGYAYDDRWQKLTIGGFFKRRLERLQPMVVMGMLIGAVCFYFGDSPLWPFIHTVPVWKMLVVMLIGFTLLPLPTSWDIRGWQEMHPLNGPGWSLFFEYIANILYAIGLRKLSKTTLSIFVCIAAAILIHYALTGKSGDMIGGWSINAEQLRIGFTRMLYPFFAGLLLSRIAKPTQIKNSFLLCSVLLCIILFMPRLGGNDKVWMNGLFEAFSILFVFPVIVYIGAGGIIKNSYESKLCKFWGDISYPIYITHYPFIYIYTAWVSNHRDAAISEAWLYGIITFIVSVSVAFLSLKYYDEPVRAWLKRTWK